MTWSKTRTLLTPLTIQTRVINRVTWACRKFMKCQAKVTGTVTGYALPSFEFLFLWCVFFRCSPASTTRASFVFLTSSLYKGTKMKHHRFNLFEYQKHSRCFSFDAFIVLKCVTEYECWFWNTFLCCTYVKLARTTTEQTFAFAGLAMKSLQYNVSPYCCTRYTQHHIWLDMLYFCFLKISQYIFKHSAS